MCVRACVCACVHACVCVYVNWATTPHAGREGEGEVD